MPSWKTKGLLLLVHYHPLTSGVSVSWPYAVSASSHQVVLEDPTPLSLLHGPLHLFSFLHSIPVDLGFIHGLSIESSHHLCSAVFILIRLRNVLVLLPSNGTNTQHKVNYVSRAHLKGDFMDCFR